MQQLPIPVLFQRFISTQTYIPAFLRQGVVYITDETSRHEVTSWRLDQANEAAGPAVLDGGVGGTTTHVVVVVDSSGSMRKEDVPGYDSRTAAVSEHQYLVCLSELFGNLAVCRYCLLPKPTLAHSS